MAQNSVRRARAKTISAQLDRVIEGYEEVEARYQNAIDDVNAKSVERIRGLCSYAQGTGQGDAGIRYLLEECKAFDNARGKYQQRRALFSQIVDVMSSVADAAEKQSGAVSDNSILAQYERLEGEDATAFYREHQATITSQLQARLDGNQNN